MCELCDVGVIHRYEQLPSPSDVNDELAADKRDAERYRWLRAQHWSEANLCVVASPRDAVKLGYDCPSLDRLDAQIDAGIEEANAETEMMCGNCANRSGEECEAHCGREVYADADKPDWCNEWSIGG